jgi:hypothetical protein
MDGGILVPIAFFAMLAAIFVLPNYFKSRERIALQDTLRAAYQNGQPVPQDVIDAITKGGAKEIATPSPVRDIRGGIIWLAVGIGFACFAWAMGYDSDTEEAFWPILGMSAVPGVIGLALIAMGFVGLATQKKS